MTDSAIRIATRSSKLALWQAEYIKSLIAECSPETPVEIVHIKTVGDQNQTDALREFGGTGVFTREVQTSVLSGDTDIAVHSLKDLPTLESSGLALAGVPDRAPRFDALLLPDGKNIESLDQLPNGSRVGTGSPRRQAQLLYVRDDLQMLEIRGNVETRIRKLDQGEYDAIILAEAGLRRLELGRRISFQLCPPFVFPAVGQGAIGIECRDDDERVLEVLRTFTNDDVLAVVTAERALLAELRAGCHAPLGVLCELADGQLELQAVLLSQDGKTRLESSASGRREDPIEVGVAAARRLLEKGGDGLVDAV